MFDDGRVHVKTVQQYDGEQQFLTFDSKSFSTTSNWSNDGVAWNAPYSPADPYSSTLKYVKIGDIVYLQGFADAGATLVREGQYIGTLPEGFRPAAYTTFLLCPTWGWPPGEPGGYVGTAGVFIFGDGRIHIKTVQQYNGVQRFIVFDSVWFSTSGNWSNDGIIWTAPYAPSGSYPSTLKYMKIGDVVYLQGSANAGGTRVREGQFIGTLPEGFRPPAATTRYLLCPTWGWPSGKQDGYVGTAGVFIFDDGSIRVKTVQQYNAEQQYLMFDSACFSTMN